MDSFCRAGLLAIFLVAFMANRGLGQVHATFAPMTTHILDQRDECPGGTFQCQTSLGAAFSGICCANGQTCALDSSNNPACCPSGAVCTGTAPTGAPTAAPTQAISFVSNSYFSFPYALTSFDNKGDCNAAKSTCSQNYEICVSGLRNTDGLAVTVNVPGGGGVTVAGANTALASTSATSICSSLSSQACSKLETTTCDALQDSSAQPTVTCSHLAVVAILLNMLVYYT